MTRNEIARDIAENQELLQGIINAMPGITDSNKMQAMVESAKWHIDKLAALYFRYDMAIA